jgi:hypothetical protein
MGSKRMELGADGRVPSENIRAILGYIQQVRATNKVL